MNYEAVEVIFESTASGRTLLPILKTFRDREIGVYQRIGEALFRAYEAGLKQSVEHFKTAVENVRSHESNSQV